MAPWKILSPLRQKSNSSLKKSTSSPQLFYRCFVYKKTARKDWKIWSQYTLKIPLVYSSIFVTLPWTWQMTTTRKELKPCRRQQPPHRMASRAFQSYFNSPTHLRYSNPTFSDKRFCPSCIEPAISLPSHHVSLVQWTTCLLPVTRDPGSNP